MAILGRHMWMRRGGAVLLALMLLLSPLAARAQSDDSDSMANVESGAGEDTGGSPAPLQLYEQKIKAGLIYNFLKYTRWPAGSVAKANGSLRVCLLGSDAMDDYLYPLQGRTAQQEVIQITHINSVRDTDACDAVFIHKDEADNLSALLETLKGRHVLTLSDIDQFAQQGGMVEFGMQDQRINLLINKPALSAAGLDIEDRLVKLAKLVTSHSG